MKFGTRVLVLRGSPGRPDGTLGCSRMVAGVLIWARGNELWVRLLEDDPFDTIGWCKAGDVGHWGNDSVIEGEKATP